MDVKNVVQIDRPMNDNLTRLYIGDIVIWFSYETPVAFHVPGASKVVSENCWLNTTGRHLNAIDGGNKNSRVPRDEFVRLYNEMVTRLSVILGEMF